MNHTVEKIAKERIVEEIVKNISKDSTDEDLPDLIQDIYIELLKKDEDFIEEMFCNGQLNYYITRMVVNNLMSKTSRFYYTYRKNKLKNVTLDEWKETDADKYNGQGS